MNKWKVRFIEGIKSNTTMTENQAEDLWIMLAGNPDDPDDNGFADYCFNASHSISYSLTTYICAYLKANYPVEFFTALMSVRSQSLQPKDWAAKAPQYCNEAKLLNVNILGPDINKSKIGFINEEDNIFFGLNAIRDVGKTAARSIIAARGNKSFESIQDFIFKINRQKVTKKTFQALVYAGCFDRMGYRRSDLIENTEVLYDYWSKLEAHYTRAKEIEERTSEINTLEKLIEERDELRVKKRKSEYKRNPEPELTEKELLRLNELEDMKLRRLSQLSENEKPEKIEIPRLTRVGLTLKDLIDEGNYIGCYVKQHPARIIFSETQQIVSADFGQWVDVAGVVVAIKKIKTRKGDPMAFVQLSDESETAELIIFPTLYKSLTQENKIPIVGDLIRVAGKCEETDPSIKIITNKLMIYDRE